MPRIELNKETYVGDSVYAKFDGENLWLRADRDGSSHEIAINSDNWNAIYDLGAEVLGDPARG
jgi:hypothetical protein